MIDINISLGDKITTTKVKVQKVKHGLQLSNGLERNNNFRKNIAGSSRFSPVPLLPTTAPPSPPDSSCQDSLLLFFFLGLVTFDVGSDNSSKPPLRAGELVDPITLLHLNQGSLQGGGTSPPLPWFLMSTTPPPPRSPPIHPSICQKH